ncbi:hypothetical protein [Streptomyces sp. NPDC002187]|uniref:hypothetical protein n=1 Tax=Streptomyces sp. NPDC002187 TaxID=3364637 RepID=UPI0036BD57F7
MKDLRMEAHGESNVGDGRGEARLRGKSGHSFGPARQINGDAGVPHQQGDLSLNFCPADGDRAGNLLGCARPVLEGCGEGEACLGESGFARLPR